MTIKNREKWLLPVSSGLLFFVGFEAGALQYVLLGVTYEFALGSAMVGTLLATQYFALMIAQPVFGIISDRIGKKPIILFSMCLFILGCALIAGAPGILVFVLGVFAAGMGYGVTESLICATLVDVFPEKAERYTNISQSFFSLGAVAGPLAANQFALVSSARLVFIFSALGFLILLPFFASIPQKRVQPGKVRQRFELKKNPAILFAALLVAIFIYGGAETASAGFFNSLFSQALAAPEFGAFAISTFWLSMMISRIFFGMLKVSAKRVTLVCMIACAVVLALMSISRYAVLSLIFCALAGFSAGPVWAMLVSFAAKEFPAHSGTAVSFMSMSSGLGATLIPILVGWSAALYNLHTAMLMIGIIKAVGVLSFLVYIRRKPCI